jgi:hypothetical protein
MQTDGQTAGHDERIFTSSEIRASSVDGTKPSRFHLRTETESSWIMSRNTIIVLIYHHHKLLDIIIKI